MALTPDQAAELKAALDAANESGAQLQKALEAGLQALLAQGAQLKENAEIAQRIAVSLVGGKDATEASRDAINNTIDARLLAADLDERRKLAAEGEAEALRLIYETLQKTDETSAARIKSIENEIEAQNTLNKRTEQRSTNLDKQTETTKKLTAQEKALAVVAALGTGAVLLAGGRGSQATKMLRKGKIKPKIPKAPKGKAPKGKGGTGILPGMAGAAAYDAASDALETAAKTLKQWTEQANKANKAVNAQQTGLASSMGQVMKYDMAVRKSSDRHDTFGQRIVQLQEKLSHLGYTGKDVGEAFTNLTTHSRTMGTAMSRLGPQNTKTTDDLATLALEFKSAGINTETFGQSLDILGKTYRVSNIKAETEALNEEFVNIAAATGQLSNAVGQDAVKAFDTLAVYSLPQAKKIFRELSVTVAETGVSMDTMLSVAGAFDNIDQAASKVGTLNAMLGGPYLNTLDMVNATEEERVAMIREAVAASGEQFGEMDRFKQKAIAQQLGLKSIAEARKLLDVDQSVIDEKTAAIDENFAKAEDMFRSTGKGAEANAVSLEAQFTAAQESAFLVDKAFTHIEDGARAVNQSLFEMGKYAEEHIGETIAGLAKDTATQYKIARNFAREGEGLAAVFTQLMTPVSVGVSAFARATNLKGSEDLGGTVGQENEPARLNPAKPAAARGQIPTTQGTAGPSAAEVAAATIEGILGGGGGGGKVLKAHIVNEIKLDRAIVDRIINDNVDMHLKEGGL